MNAPAWTREWRPLLSELCAGLTAPGSAQEADTDAPNALDNALLVDRVVSQLYSHRYLDCTPNDVASQIAALGHKFQVHSLGDRAEQLETLVGQLDMSKMYLVVKMLLEVAEAPTRASDSAVAMRESDREAGFQRQQTRQSEEQAQSELRDKLMEELFQISVDDDWFQAWDEEEDEGPLSEEEDELSSADEEEEPPITSRDTRSSSMLDAREELAVLDPIAYRDQLLLSYYDPIDTSAIRQGIHSSEPMDWEEPVTDEDEGNVTVENFSVDKPCLLYSIVRQHQLETSSVASSAAHRIVHEQTLVNVVFQALTGVESFVFAFRPPPSKGAFHDEETSAIVQLSRASRGLAVAHLSPSALHSFLNRFAALASDLQLLRHCTQRLQQNVLDMDRCCALDGLASALSQIILQFEQAISLVFQEAGAKSPPSIDLQTERTKQPTLLSIYAGLKHVIEAVSWVKSALMNALNHLSGHDVKSISAAENAEHVLSALYHQLEEVYVVRNPIEEDRDGSHRWSRSDLLLSMFASALAPYLDLLHRMLFERGYASTIPLQKECFFVGPRTSQHSLVQSDHHQAFQEALLILAPFEIDKALVPVFLVPVVELMHEALASRQMMNRFLQQQAAESRQENVRCSVQDPISSNLGDILLNLQDLTGKAARSNQQETDHWGTSFVPFSCLIRDCLVEPIQEKCRVLNGAMTGIFRDQLQYMEHIKALRMFVLMRQQDVFSMLSDHLMKELQTNQIAWADGERINAFYQGAMQVMQDDHMISDAQRQLGARICIRVDATQLKAPGSSHKIDISALKCLYTTFSTPQPLRVLFSASIMRKYSRLGTFLLQVKAVELALVKFKRRLRHRRCFSHIESELRCWLVRVADMLHYTKTLQNYLTSQLADERWMSTKSILETSNSLSEINEAHEQYLDQLLHRFFLLEKHATVIQYILTTFNQVMRFISQLDAFVLNVERNMRHYFPQVVRGLQYDEVDDDDEETTADDLDSASNGPLLLRKEHAKIHEELAKSAAEFKRQAHILVVMLTSMEKHGASPHVSEIATQLNFNYFYHRQEQQQSWMYHPPSRK